MGFLSRAVDSLALVGQTEGVAVGGSQQPPVDQVADRGVNVIEVVKQQAREGGRVDLTLGVRGVDDLVLKLGELHPTEGSCRVGCDRVPPALPRARGRGGRADGVRQVMALVPRPVARAGRKVGAAEAAGRLWRVTVTQVIDEVGELTPASIRFAEGIDHATSGDQLGRIMQDTMKANPGAYAPVRAVVQSKVDDLGGAGQAIGLFMLAADLATTAAVGGDQLGDGDRRELRRLWVDLRAQG